MWYVKFTSVFTSTLNFLISYFRSTNNLIHFNQPPKMPPFTFTLPTLNTPILLLLAVTLTISLLIRKLLPTYKFPTSSPPLTTSTIPVLGAIKFFTSRWKFFRHARDESPSGHFSFFLGRHPVVGVSGEEGRRLFFESREMGMREGYVFLFIERFNEWR